MNKIIVNKKGEFSFIQVNEMPLKILCFTDTHISYNMTEETFSLMERLIDSQKPDLVIITGDVVTCDNCIPLYKRLAEFFITKELCFSIVLGNHDGEYDKQTTRKEIIKLLSTYDNFILSAKNFNIYGNGNEFIYIKNAIGETISALIFIDSGDYLKNDLKKEFGFDQKTFSYDTVKQNQVDWYEQNIKLLCKDKLINSFMFLHIPPYEANLLLRKGQRIYGNFTEAPCNPKINVGFVDKIAELKSTKAIFYGHDHINDANYIYNDINFVYVQSSGYDTYVYNKNQRDKRGGTLITLDEKGYNIKPICLSELN